MPEIPDNLSEPAPVTATVQGNILDENGDPAAGVTVKAGNKNAITDAKGYFRIINASLDKSASLVTAEKTGYFKAYRSFSASKAANHIVIKLTKKQLSGVISAAGGEITIDNDAKLSLPANGVVKAAGGNYTGDIKVYAAYIDPTAADIGATVPGSFMADNAASQRVILASYGMMAVELESAAGEKLQIASGKLAKLTMPIPASILSSAPASISLWYIDEATGLWKEEGKASRSGNNYIGEVKHFSFWNCDIGLPTVMLSVTLKNGEGLPLVHTQVKMTAVMNGAPAFSYGYTDSLGKVNGLVPADQSLKLDVLSDVCSTPVYTTTLGPYSTGTDAGTITVTSAGTSITTIQGKLVNCTGTPVTAGTAIVNLGNSSFYVNTNLNGEFALAYVKCDNSPSVLSVIGMDKDKQEESSLLTFPLNAPVTNTGTITACGTSSAQFFNYRIDGVEFTFTNITALDSLEAFSYLDQQPTPHYVNYLTATSYAEAKRISFSFHSPTQAAGTYAITSLTANQYSMANVVVPTTVTVTGFPQSAGSFYEGNFAGQFRDSLGQDPIHTISGSFRIRKQ